MSVKNMHLSLMVQAENLNIGAKVLSARLPNVLNLLTTTLTACLCKAKEQVAKSGEIRQRTTNR